MDTTMLNTGAFELLTYEESMAIDGGDYGGLGDLVRAIFECGRELGRAIRNLF